MRRLPIAGALLLLGCSCDDGVTDSFGGSGATSTGGTGSSNSTTSGGPATTTSTGTGAGGAGPDDPCAGWPGWASWDDFAPEVPFCYAIDPAASVAPIEWVPCDPLSGMTSGCREMKVDWPWAQQAIGAASAFLEADGTVALLFTRANVSSIQPTFIMPIYAAADGPVRAALLDRRAVPEDYAWFLSTSMRGVGEGRATLEVAGLGAEPPLDAQIGLVAGQPRPFVEQVLTLGGGHYFGATGDIWGISNAYAVQIARWGEEPVEVWGGVQSGLQNVQFVPFGEFASWREGNYDLHSVVAWTPDRGAYRLIDHHVDPSQSAEGFTTDGVHMTWVHREGRASGKGPFPVNDIVAAPYEEDPALLTPTRLRTYPSAYVAIGPGAVGCGYAGYSYEPGKVLITRIADGYWWELPSSGCTGPNFTGDWCFEHPYLITCEEVFLRGGAPMNVARVEIAALGDPNPPD